MHFSIPDQLILRAFAQYRYSFRETLGKMRKNYYNNRVLRISRGNKNENYLFYEIISRRRYCTILY